VNHPGHAAPKLATRRLIEASITLVFAPRGSLPPFGGRFHKMELSTPMPELVQRRHGTRLRAQIPLRVTSLDPGTRFSERCHTMLVNPNGCGIRFPRSLKPGMRVKMEELPTGATVTATVASNVRICDQGKYWLVGLGLDSPRNLWCISPVPPDWDSISVVRSH